MNKIYNIKDDYDFFVNTKAGNSSKMYNEKYISDLGINNIKKYYKKEYDILRYLIELNIITNKYYNNFI